MKKTIATIAMAMTMAFSVNAGIIIGDRPADQCNNQTDGIIIGDRVGGIINEIFGIIIGDKPSTDPCVATDGIIIGD